MKSVVVGLLLLLSRISADPACCESITATCVACREGISKEEFCRKQTIKYIGCDHETITPLQKSKSLLKKNKGCCRAYTAKCLACVDGVSVQDFCKQHNNDIVGCVHASIENKHEMDSTPSKNVPSLESVKSIINNTASSNVTAGIVNDIPRACCRAFTAKCLSCTEGISVEEYCRLHQVVGCDDKKNGTVDTFNATAVGTRNSTTAIDPNQGNVNFTAVERENVTFFAMDTENATVSILIKNENLNSTAVESKNTTVAIETKNTTVVIDSKNGYLNSTAAESKNVTSAMVTKNGNFNSTAVVIDSKNGSLNSTAAESKNATIATDTKHGNLTSTAVGIKNATITIEATSVNKTKKESLNYTAVPNTNLTATFEAEDKNSNSTTIACCMAYTAECIACTEGMTVEEVCEEHDDEVLEGCETVADIFKSVKDEPVEDESSEQVESLEEHTDDDYDVTELEDDRVAHFDIDDSDAVEKSTSVESQDENDFEIDLDDSDEESIDSDVTEDATDEFQRDIPADMSSIPPLLFFGVLFAGLYIFVRRLCSNNDYHQVPSGDPKLTYGSSKSH